VSIPANSDDSLYCGGGGNRQVVRNDPSLPNLQQVAVRNDFCIPACHDDFFYCGAASRPHSRPTTTIEERYLYLLPTSNN